MGRVIILKSKSCLAMLAWAEDGLFDMMSISHSSESGTDRDRCRAG